MRARGPAPAGRATLIAALAVTVVLCTVGFWLKFTCSVPGRVGCYSDLSFFWEARGVASHSFPYINGGLDSAGEPYGSTYEYPVLTGVLIWLSSLPASDVTGFLRMNALIDLVLACAVTSILWWQAGRRVWWWAASPALVLYPLLNWDLPAVLCAAAGFAALCVSGWSLRRRVNLAALAFALGFAFKIYPGFFVLPLLLFVLYGRDGRPDRARWRMAVEAGLVALATVVAVNLPFVLMGRQGWWASIHFQQLRKADFSTNSLWWWGVRPMYGEGPVYDALVGWWSPRLVLVGFALACYAGWRVSRGRGGYPWVGVSAAMLAVFLVFHKVDSPQYALWLIPLLALVRVHPLIPLSYLVANVCVGVGYFWRQVDQPLGTDMLTLGVWGQIVVLLVSISPLTGASTISLRDDVSTTPAPGVPRGERVCGDG